ncbi:WD repeat-containing protein 25-like [Planoprotostelium fungivorum]|uniref:WD repeat-containing protein 25-like n=1 Tax=Planoprotostelium fungivorum TaxID=1890364 RepID=A0A2P6NZK5_9EUKA|nr:WD repeat-containing protein 25-like [Planoprotostelium fungivorum]
MELLRAYVPKRDRKNMIPEEEKEETKIAWIRPQDDYDMFSLPEDISAFTKERSRSSNVPQQCTKVISSGHNGGINCIRWSKPCASSICSYGWIGKNMGYLSLARTSLYHQTSHRHNDEHHELSDKQAGAVKQLQWNYDGRQIVTASYDRSCILIDVETGARKRVLSHPSYVLSLSHHPIDHDMLVTGTSGSEITLWDTRSDRSVATFPKTIGQIQSVEFFLDGSHVITSSDITRRNAADKALIVWDYPTRAAVSNQVYAETYSCPSVRVHPNERDFLAQSSGDYIALFSTKRPFKMNKKKRYAGHRVGGYGLGLSISPDGAYVASGSSDGKLYVWDFVTSSRVKVLWGEERAPHMDVVFHPIIPGTIAAATINNNIVIYE